MTRMVTERSWKDRPCLLYTSDNAEMIGVAAYYQYINGARAGWDLNAVPNLKLGER